MALLLITIVGPAARAYAQAAVASPDSTAQGASAPRDTLTRSLAAPRDTLADSQRSWISKPLPAPAGPSVRLASPFPRVPLGTQRSGRYTSAYWAMGTGAALVGASFLLGDRANDTYAAYLRETDPSQIERLFDRSVWLDRGSSGTLLLGEALLCLGIYGRFLHRPPASPEAWRLEPGRCVVSYRF